MLSIFGQSCLVVGGGGVALGKVQGLVSEGAKVRVVAPKPLEALVEMSKRGEIELLTRSYASDDVVGFSLVFAVTDDNTVNKLVSEEARRAGIWVNVADDPGLCSFYLPARVRRGSFQLAIGSAGGAPFVVRRLRQLLEKRFGPEWAEWTEAAARYRQKVRALDLPLAETERRYDQFFSATVNPHRLTARVPTVAEQDRWIVKNKKLSGSSVAQMRSSNPNDASKEAKHIDAGLVSLVGAGPGDAGLLTMRGRQRLFAADAIVYDRLATTSLPCDLPDTIQFHCVGKEAGHHPMPQEEIHAMLVRLASEGKRVVRFKGGDPYVFGRGGEEIEALNAAGIPFEVIPGVTAGTAVSAYAGIPVTHRGEAVRVTLITSHESTKGAGPQVQWDLIAKDPCATILGYMGVASLSNVCARLESCGMDPQMPAAIIERGTTSAQRTVHGTVHDLPQIAKKAGIVPPSLFVIGPTVGRAEAFDWFTRRPLFGQRIGLFAQTDSLPFSETLEMDGAEVVEVSMPLTAAARIVLAALPLTGWVFRNVDELDAIEDERDTPGFGPDVVAWCLNPDVVQHAKKLGWRQVRNFFLEDPNHSQLSHAKQKDPCPSRPIS